MPKLIDEGALLRTTTELLAERGYDSLTTQEVARRAGINEATIYRRYGTKAALVEAALTAQLTTTPFANLPASEDLEADLTALVSSFLETTRTLGGAVTTVLGDASRHPELRPALAPLLVNIGRAAAVLEHHQALGTLAAGDTREQLGRLVGPILAAGLWSRTGTPAPVTDPGEMVAAFLDGHRAR